MPPPPITGANNLVNNPLYVGLNGPLMPGALQPVNNVPQADIGQVNAPNEPNGPEVVPPPPDPALDGVIVNGEGPDLQPGNGQGAQFSANHTVSARNWNLNTANGMLDTARKSVEYVRAVVTGTGAFRAYDEELGAAVAEANANAALSAEDREGLLNAYQEFKVAQRELRNARASLMDAVDIGKDCPTPEKALEKIQKTMRVFRYELQKELGKLGHEAGKMSFNEGNLRAIQHALTFGVKSNVAETFARVMELETRYNAAIADVRNRLREMDRTRLPPVPPQNLMLASVADDALQLSHITNDRIREFQAEQSTESTLRAVVGQIAEKGGSRRVEFTVGAGAMLGLGFSEAFVAGLRVGARFKMVGEIESEGKGSSLNVTFRISGGVEAKGIVKAGEESTLAGARAEATAGADLARFTTRTYPSLEDLILDAKRCKLATSRSVPDVIVGGLKSLGKGIGALGTKFFRWLGRKSGEIKQSAGEYLQSLKSRGIAGALDRLLMKNANPQISAERGGAVVQVRGNATASTSVGSDISTFSVSGNISHEREFNVSSVSFVPIERAVREAKDIDALDKLMLPGPAGGNPRPVDEIRSNVPGQLFEVFEGLFEKAIREAEEKENSFIFTDTIGFALAANKIRSLLLSTELAVRQGRLSRDDADTLMARYANPPVKFPLDIYREYLQVGSGVAKPPKIRTSASASFEMGLFTSSTNSMTSGITNDFGKALANGAVKELRHQIGLDTKFEYRYNAEKPAKPDSDPRPWENVKKSKHSVAITASAPIRILMEAITRTVANGGERLENKSDTPLADGVITAAKELPADAIKATIGSAMPGLILATVKASALAAVKSWLSNEENIVKLVLFALDHLDDALELIVDAVVWAVDHPDAVKLIVATAQGTDFISKGERNKVFSWSYVDGKLDTITVESEKSNKIGLNVDPMGVGVGAGFDISYSVTESLKDRSWMPNPTLLGLLEKSEMFLFGESGMEPSGGGQAFKLFLSRNATGVAKMLDSIVSPRNVEIYQRAQAQAQGDFDLQDKLQTAWREALDVPRDAPLDVKVDAAHKLLVALTLAYRK